MTEYIRNMRRKSRSLMPESKKKTRDTRKTMQDPGHHIKGLRDVLVQCFLNNKDNNNKIS